VQEPTLTLLCRHAGQAGTAAQSSLAGNPLANVPVVVSRLIRPAVLREKEPRPLFFVPCPELFQKSRLNYNFAGFPGLGAEYDLCPVVEVMSVLEVDITCPQLMSPNSQWVASNSSPLC